MNTTCHAGVALALLSLGTAQATVAQAAGPPTLVVMIAVDQLRGDLVDRYEVALDGGFRRILDEGHRFTQASHAHAMTETAPGHATLATGALPSRHGIVSNNWRQRSGFEWANMYAVGDPEEPILGFENEPVLEGRSPKNNLRTALADWVRAADPDARTVSISKKDRAAVTMAGQTSDNVWWLLDQLGIFVTSTFYADRYPGWINDFNERVMPGIRADSVWESEVPMQLRDLARADSADYEGRGGANSSFPHLGTVEGGPVGTQEFNMWAFDQPRADDAVLELAKAAIEEQDLGQRDNVDLLAISFSALDRVGHRFGPLSQEMFSTLIHLDGVLGELFEYLDETIGRGRWVAGLAGDHGVTTNPEAAQARGDTEAERIIDRERYALLSTALQDAAAEGGRPEEVAERLAGLVEERELVRAAYTHRTLARGGEPPDSFAVLFRNSYYPGRAWGVLSRYGVEVRFDEGDLVTPYPTGTDHGTSYWHDRHVEMMLLGAGISPGTSAAPVYTVDFAPTLAGLAGIPTPDDLDGRRLF